MSRGILGTQCLISRDEYYARNDANLASNKLKYYFLFNFTCVQISGGLGGLLYNMPCIIANFVILYPCILAISKGLS